MMGAAEITVLLAVYWVTGAVGAASLSSDDQYSPYQPPYRRAVSQEPPSDLNWLKYQQDLTAKLESPVYIPETRKPDVNYILRNSISRKDSVIRDLDILHLASGGWKITGSADVAKKSGKSTALNSNVPEDSKSISPQNDDNFAGDDTFQDQGPGSVEIYKLDLSHDSSLLVPHANGQQVKLGSRIKSKIPKKAIAEEIVWRLKSMETGMSSLPSIFRQPPNLNKDSILSRKSDRTMKDEPRDEVFAVGGVPELQVGCEGLEASNRQKRSTGPDVQNSSDEDWDDSHKYQDPVYRESTEPILLRVTPIVLDIEDTDPPSGEVYEEMDELLKLKKLESTSPKSTTRRSNRADIDPAIELDKHQKEQMSIETFPERGDLGPKSDSNSSEITESPDVSKRNKSEKGRFRRDTVGVDSSVSLDTDPKDMKDSIFSTSGTTSFKHSSGRKLLWAQYPGSEQNRPEVSRRREASNQEDPDLWGFGEDDGELSDDEGEADVDELRQTEAEKRRREYERRKLVELERRREKAERRHQAHSENLVPENRDVNAEIERIREEYEKQLEREERERQRILDERRAWKQRHDEENNPRRLEDTRRRQEEESRRRLEEEHRRREWSRRHEEEERRRKLENERNHENTPTSPSRMGSSNIGHVPRSQQEKENEERKLRNYMERNRPIDPKKNEDHRRHNEHPMKQEHDERRKYEERRRMEEDRRRQEWENERRKQIEEERRHHERHEEERRKNNEDSRRRERPESRAMEEERRRRLEEEQKLQDYVRRNQPVVVSRKNSSQAINRSQENDLQEQRRTIEAARRWDRNWRPVARTDDGRAHGPSAPANIGQRHPQDDLVEIQRRQQKLEEERQREIHRRRLEEEERRREVEYQRAESMRREEERKRLEDAVRREEEKRRRELERRRNPWQDYGSPHRPAGEIPDREAEELRRRESTGRTTDITMRNQQEEWRRRSEERDRQQKQHEERERRRLEMERNSRYNGHRRPHHEDNGLNPRQRGESVRGGHDAAEWRRREHTRLNSLPVSARIILRLDDASGNGSRASTGLTSSTPLEPFRSSIRSRANFDNDIGFPALSPNRPGLRASRFPAPATSKPPIKSPGACVWAIVQCCPANDRLTNCFESMGCPGVNWGESPCRSSLADAARAEVVKFYEAADEGNARF